MYQQGRSQDFAITRNIVVSASAPSTMFCVSLPVSSNMVFAHDRARTHVNLPTSPSTLLDLIYCLCRLTDWFFFLVLDIGNPVLDEIPVGVRVINGLIQATCVRAAGFAAVPLAALAPAVKLVCTLPSSPRLALYFS